MMNRPNLKIAITGHIDHGKSTLIGRILLETKSLPGDKIKELQRISREFGKDTELAYLTDQLKEEREKNITIDTTEIFVKTRKRDYDFIDTPGHLEFVKNMLTGASHADAAMLIVDAAQGVREQTRRHAFLLNLLNVSQVLVVVNKMDLLNYDERAFLAIKDELCAFLKQLQLSSPVVIPVSAKENVNILKKSTRMGWHKGPSLLGAMDALKSGADAAKKPLRLPVQDVYRIDGQDIVVGRVTAGTVGRGQRVHALPSGQALSVDAIKIFEQKKRQAVCGQSIGLVLSPSGQVQRGSILCAGAKPPKITTTFTGNLFWLGREPLRLGEEFLLRCSTQESAAVVRRIDKRTNPVTLEILDDHATLLNTHEAALVQIELKTPALVEPYAANAELGRYVLERAGVLQGAGTVARI